MTYNFENLADIAHAANELIARGNNINLHVVIELGYRYNDITIVAYTLDNKGELDSRAFEKRGRGVDDAEKVAGAFAELSEFLDKYTEDREGRLSSQISKLTEELKAAKSELKKIKKNSKKN